MDNLIYDAISIFSQLLQRIAPEYFGEYGFKLTILIFASVFVLLTMWALYKIFSAFATVALQWLSRGW